MQVSKAWIETCVERVEAKKAAFEAVFRFIPAMPSSLCLPTSHELGLEQSGQPLLLETMLGGGYTKCCRPSAHSAVPVSSYNMSAVLTCRRKKRPASATWTDGGGEAGWKNSRSSLSCWPLNCFALEIQFSCKCRSIGETAGSNNDYLAKGAASPALRRPPSGLCKMSGVRSPFT